MRPSRGIYVLSYLLGTISLRKIVLSLVFCAILLGWVLPPSAEIYRWRDREGVIRYSNKPPADESLVIQAIPTERIPLLEDENGMIYYLHVPEGNSSRPPSSQQVPGQLALPPEVLDRLLQEASQTRTSTEQAPSPDLTALTIRLAELERLLKQEMTTRQQWEQEYRQAQSYSRELEQQNETLKFALTEMQTKFEHLQQNVETAKAQMTALQPPAQKFEMLENQVAQLQTSMTDINQYSQQAADQVHTRVNALYARLEHVETDLQALRHQPVADHVSASQLSQKLEELKSQLPHPQQIEALSQKFASLESKVENLKLHTLESQNMTVQDIQTRLASLEATLESGEFQQAPMSEFQGKLAALESHLETLQEMIPTSQQSHELVEKLLDNGKILKNVVAFQSEQLDAQKAQIARLDNVLTMQQERLDALETLLKQAQSKGMSAISRLSDQEVIIIEEPTSGRILIVPRKERRTTPESSLFEALQKSVR